MKAQADSREASAGFLGLKFQVRRGEIAQVLPGRFVVIQIQFLDRNTSACSGARPS